LVLYREHLSAIVFYIFGGLLIAQKISRNQHIVSWVIGGIFLATAILQIWNMVRKKKKEKKKGKK
jgi:uncharacterized membrane protein HdeD (DUF308 family)